MPAEAEPFDAARRRQIEALFDQVMDFAPAARQEILATACRDDPELRREVEALLELAGQSGLTARLGRRLDTGAEAPPGGRNRSGYLAGQLRDHRAVGGGGMGVMYRAYDRGCSAVALKFLAPSISEEPEVKSRFLQEAKAIASLDHPNLCSLFDVAEPEGQLVIVMPFYEGETLKQKLGRGPLPLDHAVDYAVQIAAGLAHAHAAGVVHRDIKPANVIVTAGERVRILDFGIAKVSAVQAKLTRTGMVLGTLAYMSPEQASGERIDHRTDLWALGVVLYEMLTGRQPFTGDSLEALFHAILWPKPERVTALRPEVPPGLEALVHRLLEKNPANRYQDAVALMAELEAVRADVTPSSKARPAP